MKKIFTVVLLAFLIQFSYAQEEKKEVKAEEKTEIKKNNRDDINTIFTKENLKVTGGYLSPELKVGNVHEDISLLGGGKIGMTFNNKFTLGLAGYGLINNSDFVEDLGGIVEENVRINMGYGGLFMEYTILSKKKIHFTIPVVFGVGAVYLYEEEDDYFFYNYNDIGNSSMLVIEPGINIEFNLFKFFRVDLGASYRFVQESSLDNLSDEDLSDFMVNATFKFGFF